MQIYEEIRQGGQLTPPHREELERRGFSDETIAKCGFFSGGEYLLKNVDITNYTPEELIRSGAFVYGTDGTLDLSQALKSNKIVIPYLSKDGKAYMLRPHKLGLKGQPPQVYQHLNLSVHQGSCILTEGEFKAAAGCQLGIPTIAIPGISSFAKDHMGALVSFLQENFIKSVCIMFDNEVKNDPNLKTFKTNSMKRWDTQYYAQFMAKSLEKYNIAATVATLPAGWMENGKIDIDGALALGKTKEDLLAIASTSKKWTDYIESLCEEARTVIKKKNYKHNLKGMLEKKFKKYYKTVDAGKKNEHEVCISNFIINIISTHETPLGTYRRVFFENEFGEKTKPFYIDAGQMSSNEGFTTFCLSKGNFIWRGGKQDVLSIWESEFLNDDGKMIYEPDHIGFIRNQNLWLFSNVAILEKTGENAFSDEERIFYTKEKGVKANPFSGEVEDDGSAGIPTLKFEGFDIKEYYNKMSDTMGESRAALAIGWSTSVFYMQEVFEMFGCFPFLFVAGKRESGKSTVAEWIMGLFGLEGAGMMAGRDTTTVAVQRLLSYYSCLPLWLDEYRNNDDVGRKNGLLRNVYNYISAGKGVRDSLGIRTAAVRGTVLLSGEETPNDNALNTRCVCISLSKKDRKENQYKWFMKNKHNFSCHAYNILKNKYKNVKSYKEVLAKMRDYLLENTEAEDRTAVNYAIVAAGFAVAFPNEKELMAKFVKFVSDNAEKADKDNKEGQQSTVFLDDVMSLNVQGRFRNLERMVSLNSADNEGYINFAAMYGEWAREYKNLHAGATPFNKKAILNQVKDEAGFLELREELLFGVKSQCIIVDMATDSRMRDIVKMGVS